MDIDNIRNVPGTFQALANPPRANREEATFIPCEFCEVPIIADELVLHQVSQWTIIFLHFYCPTPNFMVRPNCVQSTC